MSEFPSHTPIHRHIYSFSLSLSHTEIDTEVFTQNLPRSSFLNPKKPEHHNKVTTAPLNEEIETGSNCMVVVKWFLFKSCLKIKLELEVCLHLEFCTDIAEVMCTSTALKGIRSYYDSGVVPTLGKFIVIMILESKIKISHSIQVEIFGMPF